MAASMVWSFRDSRGPRLQDHLLDEALLVGIGGTLEPGPAGLLFLGIHFGPLAYDLLCVGRVGADDGWFRELGHWGLNLEFFALH